MNKKQLVRILMAVSMAVFLGFGLTGCLTTGTGGGGGGGWAGGGGGGSSICWGCNGTGIATPFPGMEDQVNPCHPCSGTGRI